MPPHLVHERLFLSGITEAAEVIRNGYPQEITHVLSVLSSPSISAFFDDCRTGVPIQAEEIRTVLVGEDESSGRKSLPLGRVLYSLHRAGPGLRLLRMGIPLDDTDDEDLLDYLEVGLNFIDQGRKEGAVLVHCFAGVSRSASFIVAYLMRSEQKSLEDALNSLKQVSAVCPNKGFMNQLTLFEEMGFKVDTSSPLYKSFRLKQLGHFLKIGEKLDCSIFGADPGLPPKSKASRELMRSLQQTAYCCAKCRRIVALEEHVVSHVAGEGKDLQKQKRRGSKTQEIECSSLFVEPLRWMTSVEEGRLEGKLICIGCNARLGHFKWLGLQCSCGSLIAPAFQIQKSKVDPKSPLLQQAIPSIHRR